MQVYVVGGGLAGIQAALCLADAGLAVKLFERRTLLGGRASSFVEPGSGELVDNCQHVTMRCCTNLEALFLRLGVSGKISYQKSVPFLDAKGRRSVMSAVALPAPLHLLPSLLAHRSLRWREKLLLARAMFRVLREGPKFQAEKGRNFRVWLDECGQGDSLIEAFWAPLLVSALNEEVDRMEAALALRVVYEGLLAHREAWQVGLPSAALGEITAKPGLDALRKAGVEVVTGKAVSAVQIESANDKTLFRLQFSDGANAHADALILALTHRQALELLPAAQRQLPFFSRIEGLGVSPIVGVHLWFDGPVLEEPYLALLGRHVQWAFRHEGNYVGLVVSAARALESKSKEEILDLCLRELREALPLARQAQCLRSLVVKERAATFSAASGSQALRPGAATSIPGLFLAGDWIDTGWPATMEGAVRGGTLAAGALLNSIGKPSPALAPSLPTARLVRWLSRG